MFTCANFVIKMLELVKRGSPPDDSSRGQHLGKFLCAFECMEEDKHWYFDQPPPFRISGPVLYNKDINGVIRLVTFLSVH